MGKESRKDFFKNPKVTFYYSAPSHIDTKRDFCSVFDSWEQQMLLFCSGTILWDARCGSQQLLLTSFSRDDIDKALLIKELGARC